MATNGKQASGEQTKAGMVGGRRLRLAIAGFGTVGSAVARILIEQGAASPFELAYILNRRIAKKRVEWMPTSVQWTEEIDEVLDSDIDVLVELVGGLSPAGTWVRRAWSGFWVARLRLGLTIDMARMIRQIEQGSVARLLVVSA